MASAHDDKDRLHGGAGDHTFSLAEPGGVSGTGNASFRDGADTDIFLLVANATRPITLSRLLLGTAASLKGIDATGSTLDWQGLSRNDVFVLSGVTRHGSSWIVPIYLRLQTALRP